MAMERLPEIRGPLKLVVAILVQRSNAVEVSTSFFVAVVVKSK